MSAASSAREPVDLAVVGAGPAGCVAAAAAAAAGLSVLLIERARLPRYKVCGCCLGPATLRSLTQLGAELPGSARPLERLLLCGWGHRLERRIDGNIVVSREQLDHALLRQARSHGVRLLSPWQARLGPVERCVRRLELRGAAGVRYVAARLVVLANGLAGGLDAPVEPQPGRVGVGLAQPDERVDLPTGVVRMAVAEQGYVGLVRLADGRVNAAASLRSGEVARRGAGAAIDAVLVAAGSQPLGWRRNWKGTPALRRWSRRRTAHRVLSIGDAGGFGEPFTGEGIGWAVRSAVRSREVVVQLAGVWSDQVAAHWSRREGRARRRDELGGRIVSAIVARPHVARAALTLAQGWPAALQCFAPGALPPQPRAGGAG